MDAKKAIDILTPGTVKFGPAEYEEALQLAREALRYYEANSLAAELRQEKESAKT